MQRSAQYLTLASALLLAACLAIPTLASAQVREFTGRIDTITKEDPTLGLTRLTGPFDLTGQPAISVPCGFTDDGLPVGLQLVGRRFEEALVFRAAHAYETGSGVPISRPPVD